MRNNKNKVLDSPAELRKRAEELLKSKKIALEEISDKNVRELIHELQVHEIELEMQNEELRKLQVRLEESRKKYTDLFEFAPIGYLILDEKGVIQEANFIAAHQLGVERSLLFNKPFNLYINTEDQDIFYLHRKKVFESKIPSTCEVRLKRKDGQDLYAQLDSILIQYSSDNYSFRTSIIDITERKKAEEEVIKQHNYLEALVEDRTADLNVKNVQLQQEIAERKKMHETLQKSEASLSIAQRIAHMGNWEWDIVKNKTSWSEELYQIFGLTPQSFSPTYERFMDFVHPDDREFVKNTTNEILFDGKQRSKDFRIILLDNSVRYVHGLFMAVLDNTGRVVKMHGTVQDITERKHIENELINTKERFWTIFENANDGILIADMEKKTFYTANKRMCQIMGYSLEEIKRLSVRDIHPEKYLTYVIEQFERQAMGKCTLAEDIPVRRKDGSIFYADISSSEITFDGNIYLMGIFRDITDRKRMQEEINSVAKFPAENPYPVLRLTSDGSILYSNASSVPFLLTWNCKVGQYVPDFLRQLASDAFNKREQKKGIEIKCGDQTFAFTIVPVDGTTYVNLYGVDITDRKRTEEKVKYMAFHDALTGLPNRTLFNDRLTLALAHAHRNREMLALLFLDLDKFKVINDTLGHTIGDQLLCNVADRLKSCIREEDTVARFAGDEFTLLLTGMTQAEHVINIAHKILSVLEQPIMISGKDLCITTTIGIALYPNDGENTEVLMKNADTAMYHAKEKGGNNYQFYTPAMQAASLE